MTERLEGGAVPPDPIDAAQTPAGGATAVAAPEPSVTAALTPAEALDFESTPDPGGPRLNLVAALVPAAIGAFFLIGGWGLTLGSFSNPGPRLWPLVLTVACFLISVLLLLGLRNASGTERFTRGVRYVALGAVSLLAYSVIEYVGFELPTVVVALVWFKLIGRETWLSSLLNALGAVVAIYLIFIIGLRVSLPHLLSI